MSETAKPAKSDLPTRAAAGVVMIAVAVGAIWFGGWPFRLLIGVAAALMLVEYGNMHKVGRAWPLVGIVLLEANLWLIPDLLSPARFWFVTALLFAGLLAAVSRRLKFGWGYLYVAIPSLALILLHGFSWQAVFWAMIVTWSTDIFAYFAGRSIGGPKLAPTISPNKTWAGLIGGMAGAAVLGAVAAYFLKLDAVFLFAGAAMGLLAQMGDLYESAMKRKAGVKDSGNILPGHGGVLDRLDGLLPVVVATLLLAAL